MTEQSTAKLIRTVGFWGLVAMCINAVVGSGVFLLPYESYKLLGRFSLWAPLLFAIPVFILVLNFSEAASHFSEPGGAYLYARTAFGDFIGFETGWMNWLARVTSLASLSNGFVIALALLVPSLKEGLARAAIITISILFLAAIHFIGVRYGAASIYVFTFGKLVPLIGFIVTIGALLSMAGTNSGTMLEGSRMLYALSLDRRMGPLSFVHPRFHTPTIAIVIHTIAALAFALSGSFRTLALLSAVARLTTYLVTCLAVPRLRKLNEGFRTPGLIVPILGTIVGLVFVYNLNAPKLIAAAIAIAVGAVIYYVSRPKTSTYTPQP